LQHFTGVTPNPKSAEKASLAITPKIQDLWEIAVNHTSLQAILHVLSQYQVSLLDRGNGHINPHRRPGFVCAVDFPPAQSTIDISLPRQQGFCGKTQRAGLAYHL
jgi:hypothetical protein